MGLKLFSPTSLTPRLLFQYFNRGDIVVLVCNKGEGKHQIKQIAKAFSDTFPKREPNNLTYVEGYVNDFTLYVNCLSDLQTGKLKLCDSNGNYV